MYYDAAVDKAKTFWFFSTAERSVVYVDNLNRGGSTLVSVSSLIDISCSSNWVRCPNQRTKIPAKKWNLFGDVAKNSFIMHHKPKRLRMHLSWQGINMKRQVRSSTDSKVDQYANYITILCVFFTKKALFVILSRFQVCILMKWATHGVAFVLADRLREKWFSVPLPIDLDLILLRSDVP